MNEKKANRIYKKILNVIVKPEIGNKTTFAKDLETAGIKMLGSEFKGVYPSDKIPKLNALKKYAILNLDRSDEPGSHWIAVAFDDDKTYVYDSFGRKSTRIIPSLFHSGNGRVIDTDPDREQDYEETNCGARSLGWLLFFERYGPKNAILI